MDAIHFMGAFRRCFPDVLFDSIMLDTTKGLVELLVAIIDMNKYESCYMTFLLL